MTHENFSIFLFTTDQSTMLLTGTKSMESSRQPKAPSKEELSIKAYTARRKMSRLRRLACLLYQSEPVICVLRKIEAEVEVGRMAIRPDKKMHADLGELSTNISIKELFGIKGRGGRSSKHQYFWGP